MARLTEVEKLEKLIALIKKKCKHKRFRVIKGASGVLNFFTIRCLDCTSEIEYCNSTRCVECLGKMKFLRSGNTFPVGRGGCSSGQEQFYKCTKCGHIYKGTDYYD